MTHVLLRGTITRCRAYLVKKISKMRSLSSTYGELASSSWNQVGRQWCGSGVSIYSCMSSSKMHKPINSLLASNDALTWFWVQVYIFNYSFSRMKLKPSKTQKLQLESRATIWEESPLSESNNKAVILGFSNLGPANVWRWWANWTKWIVDSTRF